MPNNGNTTQGARNINSVLFPVYISLIIFATTLVPSTWSGFACMDNPCMHGICIDYLQINSTHQCYCRNGFTGYSCQINWDECRTQPCLNGGSCVDGIASFNCSCPENFAGVYCEIDLSICGDICENNGTCVQDVRNVTGTGFICSCPPGFTGHHCEIDISVCNATENVCQNGGKCVDGLGTRFYCECEPGWSGETCHIEIDECESQPCLNGGICVNKINDFSCACPYAFTGKTCETKLRICTKEEDPCLNRALCLKEEADESKKTCYCMPDYHGSLCELRYYDCDEPPTCLNGGTFIDGVGECICQCLPDVFGLNCQCTADNAMEPECSFYANGTMPMPTWPSISETVHSSIGGGLFPTPTLQVPGLSMPLLPSEMFSTEVATAMQGTPSLPPAIPSPSPYDPGGGEGRGGLETTGLLPPDSTLAIIEDSSKDFIAPTATFAQPSAYQPFTSIYEPASMIPSGESISSQMYPEPTTSISIDGSEETVSLPSTLPSPPLPATATPIPTELMPGEGSVITLLPPLPSSAVGPVPDYESSDGIMQSEPGFTPAIVTDIVSTVPAPTPPGIQTVDLTAGIPPPRSIGMGSSLLPDGDIVEATASDLLSTTAPFPSLAPTALLPQSSDIPFSEDPMQQLPEPTITPSLPIVTTPNSTGLLMPSEGITDWEGVITTSLFLPGVQQSPPYSQDASIIFVESTASAPFPGVTVFPTPAASGDLPDRTAGISSVPPFEGDYETATVFVTATPTVELPLPSATISPPTSFPPNLTDPCMNYCHNNAKCIADNIEPICLCSFKFIGDRCEIPREKFRAASFTGDSFLSFRVPNVSKISNFDVSSKLVTIVPEGILLYTGVGRMYALIFTQNGHVTLHFSCGSQSMRFVETRTRVDNGFNFTLDFRMEMIVQGVSQLRCSAEVSVNQSYVMKGEQVVGRDGLIGSAAEHPIEMVYLGGIPPFHEDAAQNDNLVGILPGFRGCLYSMMVNQEPKDIYDDALDGKEVAECSSFGCVANPCHGSARCVTTHAYPFWECFCPQGYTGPRCQIIVCSHNPCQNGATCTYAQDSLNLLVQPSEDDWAGEGDAPSPTTTPSSPSDKPKPICLCRLGFGGSECQHKINITKPAFRPLSGYSAFIAYDPIPRFIDWFQLKFHFVTKNITQISLLLYSGNNRGARPLVKRHNHHGSSTTPSPNNENNHIMLMSGFDQTLADDHPEPVSDFFAVTFLQGFIALTWNLGSGTQRITTPSRIDNRLNIHTLFAGRSGRQAWLKVDGMRNVTGKTPGPLYRLNSDSKESLYIGGYKSYKFEGLSHDLPLHQGFQGCIFDLGFRVRNRLYLPRAIEGRNVKNCFEEDC